jgi:hypothetical protein
VGGQEALRCAELHPFQSDAKAAAFGITKRLFHSHAPVVPGDHLDQRRWQVRGQPPGLPLARGPYAYHVHLHRAILPQVYHAPIDRLAWRQVPSPQPPAAATSMRHT